MVPGSYQLSREILVSQHRETCVQVIMLRCDMQTRPPKLIAGCWVNRNRQKVLDDLVVSVHGGGVQRGVTTVALQSECLAAVLLVRAQHLAGAQLVGPSGPVKGCEAKVVLRSVLRKLRVPEDGRTHLLQAVRLGRYMQCGTAPLVLAVDFGESWPLHDLYGRFYLLVKHRLPERLGLATPLLHLLPALRDLLPRRHAARCCLQLHRSLLALRLQVFFLDILHRSVQDASLLPQHLQLPLFFFGQLR
mmetsp:Transcript_107212/g.303782  ORF Transcript_107212/g.303782 Transcript_107212/m.303782 type:complete len:247 (-) Transcript_107212:1891-2631(-)